MRNEKSAAYTRFFSTTTHQSIFGIVLLVSFCFSLSGQSLPNLLLYKKPLNTTHTIFGGTHRINLEYHRGLVLLPGQVNGKSGYFILDTGAPFLLVNETVEQGLSGEVAQGLQGDVHLGTSTFDNIDWGMGTLKNIEANHTDLSHLQRYLDKPFLGIVGYEAFTGKQLYIDYKQKELYINKGSQPVLHLKGAPAFEWRFTQIGHVIIVQVNVAGKNCHFILDTGSVNSMIDQSNLEEDNFTATNGAVLLESVDDRTLHTGSVSPRYFSIQGHTPEALPLLTVDLSNVSKTLDFPVSGIIGNDLLGRYTIAIDYKEQKIRGWKNSNSSH